MKWIDLKYTEIVQLGRFISISNRVQLAIWGGTMTVNCERKFYTCSIVNKVVNLGVLVRSSR